MASLSIFDDDRSVTPDFFHKRIPDASEVSIPLASVKAPAYRRLLIDHDLNNYRQDLWSFEGLETEFEDDYSSPQEENDYIANIAEADDRCAYIARSPEEMKPALRRWYRCDKVCSRQRKPVPQKQRLQQAPSDEQVHDGYKVWNVSPCQQRDATTQTNLEERSTAPAKDSFFRQTVRPEVPVIDNLEDFIELPPTPMIALVQDPIDSSTSEEENISEENRKSVARKQYHERSGILWDCAAILLEDLSLHPTNLTEYEFSKLVCLQGYEVFQWLAVNRHYLIDRAESQWHHANGLLRNNAGLDGLNANFMDDFLWMEADDQVSFIRSYKRLQLEAMALREGVRLSKAELDSHCLLNDEFKIAVVQLRKDNAVQETLRKLGFLNEQTEISQTTEPVVADNLHLKFLYGLDNDKYGAFQDLVESKQNLVRMRKTQKRLTVREHLESPKDPLQAKVAEETSSKVPDFAVPQPKVRWVLTPLQRESESSNANTELSAMSNGSSEKSNTDSSVFDGSFVSALSRHDSVSEHIQPETGPGANFNETLSKVPSYCSEVETLVDVGDLPQLKRHKTSYNDLRGLATIIPMPSRKDLSSDYCDEGSDWDFHPRRSLKKKASRIFDVFKKSFTFSSSGRNQHRRSVKDYFD